MALERQTIRAVVRPEQAGLRLDHFIAADAGELSRGMAKKLIDLGAVHLNNRRVRKCSLVLREHDSVVINIDGLSMTIFILDDAHVVYQDKHLLVVNKPAGVDSQPTPSRFKGTLYAAVSDYLKNPLRKDLKPTIGMVQRLDRDTSGLMVFSIHPAAHKGLTRAFTQRKVTKTYRALVSGEINKNEGEFRSLLARKHSTNLMKSVERGGQEAITRFRKLASNEYLTYVEVEIPTGRSHQIRAHFSEAGYPLLGDTRYGGPATLDGLVLERQMLHACALTLTHPITEDKLDFSLELPYDMDAVIHHFFSKEL